MIDALLTFGAITSKTTSGTSYSADSIDLGYEYKAASKHLMVNDKTIKTGISTKDTMVVFSADKNIPVVASTTISPVIEHSTDGTTWKLLAKGPAIAQDATNFINKGKKFGMLIPYEHARYLRTGLTVEGSGTLVSASVTSWIEQGVTLFNM